MNWLRVGVPKKKKKKKKKNTLHYNKPAAGRLWRQWHGPWDVSENSLTCSKPAAETSGGDHEL